MIDHSGGPGRIDLRAIDMGDSADQADRVIALAMDRIAANRAASGDIIGSIVGYSRELIVAAAVLLLIAAGTLATTHSRSTQAANVVSSWAQSSHVPTNAELLTAFQGYDR